MSQSINQRVVNTFVKGLITEATELTFPENASIDELNMEAEKKGNRRRRLSMQLENPATPSSFTVKDKWNLNSFVWKNAGQVSGKDFLVVHSERFLHFYRLVGDTVSDKEESFSINTRSYGVPNNVGVGGSTLSFATVKGILIVTSPAIDSFFVKYDEDTDSMVDDKIRFRIRDFEFQGSPSKYFESTDNPTQGRKYDTYNAGWTKEVLEDYSEASDESPEEDSGYQDSYDYVTMR